MADGATAAGGKPKGRHPPKRLTAPAVNSSGPGIHGDGNDLYLAVDDTGARRWALRTVVHGRRRDLGLDGATLVPLAEARELARRLRRVAREGGDAIAERNIDKMHWPDFEEAAQMVHAEHVAAPSAFADPARAIRR